MKFILPLLFVFLFVSCAPASTTQAPEASPSVGVSGVSPSPTSIASQTPEPAAMPEAIKIDLATGECMYYGGAEAVACDTGSIVIDGTSFTITLATGETITTSDGKTWTVVGKEAGVEAVDPLAWQTTEDGKIMWQAAGLELFGRDQFTVNEALSGKLYKEVFLTMVYAVNRAGSPDGFAKQYPAFVSFAKYVAEHPGKTYDGLLRLNRHPKEQAGAGEWLPAGEHVNLDKFVVRVVDRETAMAEEFISIGAHVGFLMDTVEVDGRTVFRFSFTSLLRGDSPSYNLTDLSVDNDPTENLRTLTLALNLFEALAKKTSLEGLEWYDGLILTGKVPKAMDLTQPIPPGRSSADRHKNWANGDPYLLLIGEEVSWEDRLALDRLSKMFAYALMGATNRGERG